MTDKQIIIDGVDVSGCVCIIEDYYYQQANNLANGYKHIKNVCELGESGSEYYKLFCKDNPNCYYKQLKRKEQECNKLYIQLKADEEYHKEEENTLRKIIKNKEERNIELYKENNQLKVNNDR